MYEEKTFESYFNSELDQRSNVYFALGQVQEGALGFDSSAHTRNRRLWDFLGYPFWFFSDFAGVDFQDIARNMGEHLVREINNIPPIKVNLLLQYKRPEPISSPNAKEWQHWKEPYFRYRINDHQQKLLEKLHDQFGTRALVLYAAPAIATVDELMKIKIQKKIIENTNFCKADSLRTHHTNTYTKAGTHSIACSEPEQIDRFDLLEEIAKMESPSVTENARAIKEFAESVKKTVLDGPAFGNALRERLGEFEGKGLDGGSLLAALRDMAVVREITGLQWIIATGDRSSQS